MVCQWPGTKALWIVKTETCCSRDVSCFTRLSRRARNTAHDRAPARKRRDVMSKIVAALAIATVIASPAFAQSYDPSVGSGNIASSPYRSSPTVPNVKPHHAYAHTPRALQSPRTYTAPGRERKAN